MVSQIATRYLGQQNVNFQKKKIKEKNPAAAIQGN